MTRSRTCPSTSRRRTRRTLSLATPAAAALLLLSSSSFVARAAPTGSSAASSSSNSPDGLSDDQIQQVAERMMEMSSRSWELGAAAEALTESMYQSQSVFGSNPFLFSAPDVLPSSVISIANSVMANLTSTPGSVGTGPRMLIPTEGSPADSASTGTAVLLASRTSDRYDYVGAATNQVEWLLQRTPRARNGAISHRQESVQLWSDSVLMTPPFLAYYGGMMRNQSVVEEAYNQCAEYYTTLKDPAGTNLVRHIVRGDGSAQDAGLWATGNAWTAAGMIRVLATIEASDYKDSMVNQRADLVFKVQGLLTDVWRTVVPDTGLVQNYPDASVPSSARFGDSAATALLSASTYRLAALGYDPSTSLISYAETARTAVQRNVDSHGYLMNVVDPLVWTQQIGTSASTGVNLGAASTDEYHYSPEGQAFVLMMDAAWKSWKSGGKSDGTSKPGGKSAGVMLSPQGWTAAAIGMMAIMMTMAV